jgi:hypothetical protein
MTTDPEHKTTPPTAKWRPFVTEKQGTTNKKTIDIERQDGYAYVSQ